MNTNLAKTHDAFLGLVRLGIGHSNNIDYFDGVDWVRLKALADKQGLSAVILDALNVDGSNPIPVQMKLEWIGEVLQLYELRYRQYEKAISSLSGWYNRHGFKMMVLKGYACSIDWPRPEHRPCGDIDIWLFGRQKEADALLESSEFRVEGLESVDKVKRIKADASHHHHTVFEWQGFTVENHYDFVNVHALKSSAEMEKVFKKLGTDDSHSVRVIGETVYLPSPNLHALFLVKHMVSHFAAAEISLRHVLDWAFFVEKHGKDVDWEWLDGMLVKYQMREFVGYINAICIDDLGFDSLMFRDYSVGSGGSVEFKDMKERILTDILEPVYDSAEPRGTVRRLFYKYERWQGSAWKQKLCYSESRWSAFCRGIWAKILKPSSFLA